MKITHEEAMKDLTFVAENITSKQWQKLTRNIENIRKFIFQQEKVTELLELYQDYKRLQEAKEFHKNVSASLKMKKKNYREDLAIYHQCLQDIIRKSNQIEELEAEELK